jgi:hypothetical protein
VDNEIYNFGRGLPALHYYAFSFHYKCAVQEKIFENWSHFGTYGRGLPLGPLRGTRSSEMSVLSQKSEKNKNSSHPEEDHY